MTDSTTWIGLFHVLPLPGNDALEGAVGAFVTVAAAAEDEQQFVAIVSAALHEAGFEMSSAEDVEPWSTRLRNGRPEKEIRELVKSLSAENRIALGAFYSYDAD